MKITNFGSLNIDYVYGVDHIVREGETLETTGRSFFPGGKGLNQSIALARAGARVSHAGRVGLADGQFLIDYLKQSGVDVSHILTGGGATGHAVIQVDSKGQNSIFLYGGENHSITREDIDAVLSTLEPGDFLLLQNEISEVGYLIRRAGELGLKTAFNPAPFTDAVLEYALENISYIFVNRIEAAALAGVPGEPDAGRILPRLEAAFPDAAVVLTLGSGGSILLERGERIYQDAVPADALDTTGAGDTFVGYFLSGILRGESSAQALKLAAAAAGVAVSRLGAAPAIPFLDELRELV